LGAQLGHGALAYCRTADAKGVGIDIPISFDGAGEMGDRVSLNPYAVYAEFLGFNDCRPGTAKGVKDYRVLRQMKSFNVLPD
jgi:hypothetical protein